MILNDDQINELCCGPNPMIEPFEPIKRRTRKDKEDTVYPSISYGCSHFGYDIRLSSKEFKLFTFRKGYTVVDPKRPMNYFYNAIEEIKINNMNNEILIPPHSYGLGVSLEKFDIPETILGICVGKSTYARCGVMVNVTPLEPGWRGHLTLEIFNANPLPVIIYLGEGICQIVFFRGKSPNQLYSGIYQDQTEAVRQAGVLIN